MKLAGRRKALLALIIIIVAINLISVYLLSYLNNIVHGDLYHYGLQFSLQWAESYYVYYWLALGSVLVSIALSGLSILLLFLHVTNRSESALFAIPVLLLAIASLSVLSIYSTTHIDEIVNVELYQFGLQLDYAWLWPYWLSLRFFMALQVFSIAIATLSAGWIIFTSTEPKSSSKVTSPILLIAGAIALIFSIFYNSSVSAFVGLGLVLWGIIVRYITSQEYVKKELLIFTAISNYSSIDRVFKEFGTVQKAIYLPAKYLTDVESNIIFLTKNINVKLPSSERILLEDQLSINAEKGKLLLPPGHGLARLFEKVMRTSFTKVDLRFLVQNFRRVVMEDLEIVSDFNIEIYNNTIQVNFKDSIFDYINLYEAGEFSKIFEVLGCPVSSAMACALAKASGKPTTITRYEKIKGQKTTYVTYQMLNEGEF
jgi:hypothetical protein